MATFTRAINRPNPRLRPNALIFGAIFWLVALNMVTPSATAQVVAAPPLQTASAAKRPNPVALTKTPSALKTSSRSAWQDLTPAQQLSLSPLAAHWSSLGEARKRKWIALAANYSSLPPAEQAKLHSRMTEWASLSKQQRTQARLNFAQSKQLTPAQKTATWQAYQALSPEEKQKLAISAPSRPVGAAAATKPVSPGKLTKVPLTRQTPRQLPDVPAIDPVLNRKTLLPYSKPLLEPKPAQNN